MPPWLTSRSSAALSVFIHSTNCAAASLCLESVVTAIADPPQLPVTLAEASHCGSGATPQSSLVSGPTVDSVPGPHTPAVQDKMVPSSMALFQAGVQAFSGSSCPALSRPSQKFATFLVAASLMPTVQ